MANKQLVPEAGEALKRFRQEVAAELGINLEEGQGGAFSSHDPSIGKRDVAEEMTRLPINADAS